MKIELKLGEQSAYIDDNTLEWSGDDTQFVDFVRTKYGTAEFFNSEEMGYSNAEIGLARGTAYRAAREIGGYVIEPFPADIDGESLALAAVMAQLSGQQDELAEALV
jgi:hypothetical protein